MQLSDYIGSTVLAVIPGIDKTKVQKIKLHGVEAGGVWIENQSLTNAFLEFLGVSSAPKTLVLFVPYTAIAAIYAALDEPALNEKSFGV
jgi:hypothetical protein